MQFFIFWGEKKIKKKPPKFAFRTFKKKWSFFQKVYQNNACIDLVWFVDFFDFLIDPYAVHVGWFRC